MGSDDLRKDITIFLKHIINAVIDGILKGIGEGRPMANDAIQRDKLVCFSPKVGDGSPFGKSRGKVNGSIVDGFQIIMRSSRKIHIEAAEIINEASYQRIQDFKEVETNGTRAIATKYFN